MSDAEDLLSRLCGEVGHVRATLRLGDVDPLVVEIAEHLLEDIGVAGLLEVGGNDFLGIGVVLLLRQSEPLGRPEPEQLVPAAR